jgi:sigma-E factor negative regulatory protein RseB
LSQKQVFATGLLNTLPVRVMLRRSLGRSAVTLMLTVLALPVGAQAGPAQLNRSLVEAAAMDRSVNDWLLRLHEASRRRAYAGTFVVTAGDSISSARIWHVCDGEQQMERVESLTGAPRSTFRRNDQVITFFPSSRQAVTERRESLGLFPNLLQSADSSIARYYHARSLGQERVAGFAADGVQLWPQDSLRFGYRLWSERNTGLIVKLQTLDSAGRVLEQSAFSELQLDAPVSMDKLTQMMGNTAGYQVEKPELVKITAASAGWAIRAEIPGFASMSCYKRVVEAGEGSARQSTLQWVFSDGLAAVSLFVESFDDRRHGRPGSAAMGATHTLTRRIGDWWLTAVGEVPPKTLAAFAQGLERTK